MVIERNWRQRAGRWLYRWLPMLAWMGTIYFMSGQHKSNIPSLGIWDTLLKKTAHFLAYALLAWLAWRGTREWKRPYLFALMMTIIYAASDEYHQTFVPGRHGKLFDVLIDSAGGVTALLILARLNRKGE